MVNGLASGVKNGIRTDVARIGPEARSKTEVKTLKEGRGDVMELRGSCGVIILC